MLARTAEPAVEAEIRAVNPFGLGDSALLEQQRAERVSSRLHPAPRLVVGQRVVEFDRTSQMSEGHLVVAAPILKLAVKHRLCDLKQVPDGIVMHPPALRHPKLCLEER